MMIHLSSLYILKFQQFEDTASCFFFLFYKPTIIISRLIVSLPACEQICTKPPRFTASDKTAIYCDTVSTGAELYELHDDRIHRRAVVQKRQVSVSVVIRRVQDFWDSEIYFFL